LFDDVDLYKVNLHSGDCLFIPAYHFYQFTASNIHQASYEEEVTEDIEISEDDLAEAEDTNERHHE